MIAPFAETLNFKTDRRSILDNPLFEVPALGHSDLIPDVRMLNFFLYFTRTDITLSILTHQILESYIFT